MITAKIEIDYSGTGSGASAGPHNGQNVSYSTVSADPVDDATSPTALSYVSTLIN